VGKNFQTVLFLHTFPDLVIGVGDMTKIMIRVILFHNNEMDHDTVIFALNKDMISKCLIPLKLHNVLFKFNIIIKKQY